VKAIFAPSSVPLVGHYIIYHRRGSAQTKQTEGLKSRRRDFGLPRKALRFTIGSISDPIRGWRK
jgi:hypothetical protein